jgi:uncharacterized membrane protein
VHQLEEIKISELIITLVLSMWGGFAGYLNKVINDRRAFSWVEFSCRGFIGCFTGFCVYLLSDYLKLSGYVQGGLAGMGGWLGAETVAMLKSYFEVKNFRARRIR